VRWLLIPVLALFAADAMGAELRDLLPGADVYRTARDGSFRIQDRWHFNADGTYTGVHQVTGNSWSSHSYTRHTDVAGRWSVANGLLCIAGSGLIENGRTCMSVAKTAATTSPHQYAARSQGTGQVWQMFIYPAAH